MPESRRPERYRQIRQLYEEVLERSPEEQDDFVQRAARGDPELADEVRKLLALREHASEFLHPPASEPADSAPTRAMTSRPRVRRARRKSPPTPTSFDLPPDLEQKAARRVGFIGLIAAVMAPAAWIFESWLQPDRVLTPYPAPLAAIAAILLLLSGVAIFALAWTRRVTARFVLDAGLVFEVVGALAISVSEHSTPWPAGHPIRGISWNCLWIAVFAAAVPAGYGKSVLAAWCAALMAPIGWTVATVVNSIPLPSANQWLILMVPNFATAAWAVPVLRYLHGLGAQVSHEREMGSYRLIERIDQGGMGEVWRAEHRMLARTAAIKLIRRDAAGAPALAGDSAMLHQRLQREAQAIAGLACPHTVTLYDYGVTDDGMFYLAMELLDGMDAEHLVERYGALPPARVVYFLRQICRSLAEAHSRGIVHRDLKPRNIFICRLGLEYDFVKVLDFGVAANLLEPPQSGQLTAEGIAVGTPAYMAPEAVQGSHAVDARSDIYSLGCVAYWLLTGELVFDCTTPVGMALAHLQTDPQPVSTRAAQAIPPDLECVISRCLAKRPDDRPQSASALEQMLLDCHVPSWTAADAEAWWNSRLGGGGTASVRAAIG